MKNVKLLFAAALLVVSAPALAVDVPHDGWADSITGCQACHQLHASPGGTLTHFSSNNLSCLTCHDTAAPQPNNFFSPAWSTAGMEAVPGTGGTQHSWQGSLETNGARVPSDPAFADYIADGLQCAFCHDQHGDKDDAGVPIQATYAPNSAHASYKFGDANAQPPMVGVGGELALSSITAASGWAPPAAPGVYAIKVKTVAGSSGTVEISHDYNSAVTPTWSGNIPYTEGTDFELDDPNVTVKFTVAPTTVGAIWQFYVSYPFLRASNVGDAMCLDCHADRHQSSLCVEGSASATDGNNVSCAPNGTTRYYSHPVNEALGADDRPAPLDADGSTSSLDGNPSNDLVLESGQVRCTTCHAPHNADSNSLSVDVR